MEGEVFYDVGKILKLVLRNAHEKGKVPEYVTIPGKHPFVNYRIEVEGTCYRVESFKHETGKNLLGRYENTGYHVVPADSEEPEPAEPEPTTRKRRRNK